MIGERHTRFMIGERHTRLKFLTGHPARPSAHSVRLRNRALG